MRVLGIDPGSRNTGLGVVESQGSEIRSICYRRIRLDNSPLPQRLGLIYRGVSEIISEHLPDAVAVEQVFLANNAKTALVLGQARGSAVCAAVNQHCSVSEYSALQIKRAVTGTGSAKKQQVQHMVRALLGLTHTPQADEADALACAICHIHFAQVQEKLSSAL